MEQGGDEYYQSGSLPASTLSQTVNSLPLNGSAIWARWYYLIGGSWQYTDYSYTALGASSAIAGITSPVNNSTFTSSSATFTWNWVGATGYWIDVGSTPGGNQYFQSGNLGNVLTKTVNGLPTNGSTVYVTLYSLNYGVWFSNSYTYTASLSTLAVLTSPSPSGSILGSSEDGGSQAFTWAPGTNATAYWLDIGTGPGGNQYYQSHSLSSSTLTETVNGLPTNGSQIFVTLYSQIGGVWQNNAYNFYTINSTSALATIQTPPPPGPLSGYQVTFTWNSDPNATAYWVDISNIAPGGNDLDQSGNLGTAQTLTVYNMPANGSTVYVTLYSLVGGQWLSTSATYTSGP